MPPPTPRVLICTPTHYLQGGVERILESLAADLPPRGIEVLFALAKGARFHDPAKFRAAFPAIRGVDVDGTSGTVYGRHRALRRVILEHDPDIVLIARMFDAYPVVSKLKLEGHRTRLAVTVQAYESDYFADLERYQDFVDLCVASGERIAGEVRRRTSVPAVSIPGGVLPPRRLRQAHDGPLRIGYVGRIEQVQKRVLDLPLLVSQLAVPFTLDLAGDGTMLDELRARLPDARFHGWLSTAELYERIYPELDVLVHFAEFEGMTIAPREAMAHGVVPVISRNLGAEDFVDGVNALMFDVGDVAAAADAIARLHRDRSLLEQLSARARDSQRGIRSASGAGDAWAAAFREMLPRAPRIGRVLPVGPRDSGLLTRLGIPPAFAEIARRVRKRKHGDPGSEWPHWSGLERRRLAGWPGGVPPPPPALHVRIPPTMSLRHRLGAIAYDWPRFLRHAVAGNPILMRNRAESIATDGRGVRCDWLYTSELHIANVYPATSKILLQRTTNRWPIQLTDEPKNTNNPRVSFLIGHRGMERLPNLLTTIQSIAGQGIAIECIVIEQSPKKEIETKLPNWVRYLHTPVPENLDYCRSATFNAAVPIARGEVIIAHDNDMLVPEHYASEVLARATEGWQFIDLKRFIFYLSEHDTRAIFGGAPLRDDHTTTVVQNLKGGSIAATKDAYLAIGGFDEDFVGWGGEDLEFWERARAYGRVYEYGYLPIVHLWHRAQAGKVDRDGAPALRRYEELRAIAPEDRIKRLRSR